MNLINKYLGEGKGKMAGWIAIYGGKKVEIKKSEAKDLWGAKQLAIKKLKVPKSKQGLLAIEPAYDELGEAGLIAAVGSIGKMPGQWGKRLGTFGTVLARSLKDAGVEVHGIEADGKFGSKITVGYKGKKKQVKIDGNSSAAKVVKQITGK